MSSGARMSDGRDLVVVGGGLAGLAAAVTAVDAGWRVTLLESRARLGGATHSFTRAFEGGELVVDNGQHVFLRCCKAYRDFLRRLDVDADCFLQPRLDVPVVDPATGKRANLRRDRLPAPLHLARALARYRVLTPIERARAIWGALRLRGVDREAASSDQQTLGSWLRAHKQTTATVERLFDVFTVATLNARADEASLRLGAMVFQDGLLRDAGACDIGYSRVPLGNLHGDAAHRALTEAGAQVLTHMRVRAIDQVDRHWLVRTDSRDFEADAVVLATPHDITSSLLPVDAVGHDFAAAPAALDASPILNVHVIYDRTVLTEPFVAAVDSPVQFVFDRTHASGLTSGQYVAVSVSAADAWIDRPVAELRDVFLPEIARVLPAAASAVVRDFFVTRERTATFRPAPGSGASRLGTVTPARGLLLAGAWTDTGWPATMEGAVRSGVAAARALDDLVSAPGMRSRTERLTGHDDGKAIHSQAIDVTTGNERAGLEAETAKEALA